MQRRKNRSRTEVVLSDAEIAAMLAVEETDVRMDFCIICSDFSSSLDGLNVGVGESAFDTFARCITIGRIGKIPMQQFASAIISLADRYGKTLSERTTINLHSLASATATSDREAIGVLVNVLLSLLDVGFTLNAVSGEKSEILLGRDAASGKYFGNRKVERHLTSSPPEDMP